MQVVRNMSSDQAMNVMSFPDNLYVQAWLVFVWKYSLVWCLTELAQKPKHSESFDSDQNLTGSNRTNKHEGYHLGCVYNVEEGFQKLLECSHEYYGVFSSNLPTGLQLAMVNKKLKLTWWK